MSPPPFRTSTLNFQVGGRAFVWRLRFLASPPKPPRTVKASATSTTTPAATLMIRLRGYCSGRGWTGRRARPRALVGNLRPHPAIEDDRVPAVAAVACGDDVAGAFAPGGDDPVDRLGRKHRAVGEDDDRRLGLGR